MMTLDETEEAQVDLLDRLRLLATWVSTDERATPELQIFDEAASEIERLRTQIQRINQISSSMVFQ